MNKIITLGTNDCRFHILLHLWVTANDRFREEEENLQQRLPCRDNFWGVIVGKRILLDKTGYMILITDEGNEIYIPLGNKI